MRGTVLYRASSFISGKLFFFLSLKYGVRACEEEEKNDNKAEMNGGLGWIKGLRARSHFSSFIAIFNSHTVQLCMMLHSLWVVII